MKYKLLPFLVVLILLAFPAFAQSDVEMADVMRSNGKIYVVVAVAAVVMFGLLIYLIFIDKNVSRLEKKMKETK